MAAAFESSKRPPSEQEELFYLLVDRVKDYAIYLLDLDGRVASWNTGAAEMKGYTEEEIIGRPVDLFYLPDEARSGTPAALLKKARTHGRVEVEGWRVRKDGSRFWADVVITALKDEEGALRGYAKITRDLTEHKRAEDHLHASEERFRSVADTANEAIISADSFGRMSYVNKGAERMFGYPSTEMLGKPLTLLMPQKFHDAHKQGMQRYLAGGAPRVIGKTVELSGLRRDGTEFPIELSLATWKSSGEQFFTGIIRDITERKHYEAQLLQARDDLEGRVLGRTKDLQAVNAKLQDKVIELETFHDVAIGRENKMILLEGDVQRLTSQLARVKGELERLRKQNDDPPGDP